MIAFTQSFKHRLQKLCRFYVIAQLALKSQRRSVAGQFAWYETKHVINLSPQRCAIHFFLSLSSKITIKAFLYYVQKTTVV